MPETTQTKRGETPGHKSEPTDPAAWIVDSNGDLLAGYRGRWGRTTRDPHSTPWRFVASFSSSVRRPR